MASTVLGKRTRSSATSADTHTSALTSKRRLVVNEPNDENRNPFVRPEQTEDDEQQAPKRKRSCRVTASHTVPSKHGAPEQRVAISPNKSRLGAKQGKSAVEVFDDEANAPPHTPRHRDRLVEKVAITPRHRVLVAGGKLTPYSPRTPGTPSSSVYHPARQLFSRCSAPGRLVGREREREELSTFVNARARANVGGCLYVSGPPGTGKSALVDEVLQQLETHEHFTRSTVNCMSVRSAKDLGQKLAEDLGLGQDADIECLRSCFVHDGPKDKRHYLVILDEVDRLAELDLSLLYNLFEWSMQKKSRLTLIGIANALDLTDRLMPRLKSRNIKPELLPFMPYDAAQITDILTTKLRTLAPGQESTLPFLQPAAIQFCAKKVAAQSGDLRKAFDICKRAIDLIDAETREKDAERELQNSPSKIALMENINLSSPTTPRSPSKQNRPPRYTAETAPKATIAHIAKVTSQVFGNGTTQRLTTLNMQQKAVLCALSALEKSKQQKQMQKTMFATPSKHNSSAPSVKQLFEAYSALCKRDNLFHALTAVEFRDVVSGLEGWSLISNVDATGVGSLAFPVTPSRTPGRKPKNGFGAARSGDDRRVASAIGPNELRASLEGPGGELLKEMLDQGLSTV